MMVFWCDTSRGATNALVVVLFLALTACVAPRSFSGPGPGPGPAVDLKARSETAQAACRAQPLVSYVARAKCLNDAAMIAAPLNENPDLFRRALNARIEIATRVDKKEITPEEGANQYAEIEARLAEEGKARLANGE
ncbi:MAG: hypothetical protein JO357_07685 [Hyphomicrobiales bacterium]|nr:hypothetical protein [Hyphomicrobiales bacterium]MBV9751921.1 hypothetical protein [Hyphomicrobiales bacterium]